MIAAIESEIDIINKEAIAIDLLKQRITITEDTSAYVAPVNEYLSFFRVIHPK